MVSVVSSLLCVVFGAIHFLVGYYMMIAVYALLDIIIPIWLNILFINKLHQIGKFMISSTQNQMKQTPQLSPTSRSSKNSIVSTYTTANNRRASIEGIGPMDNLKTTKSRISQNSHTRSDINPNNNNNKMTTETNTNTNNKMRNASDEPVLNLDRPKHKIGVASASESQASQSGIATSFAPNKFNMEPQVAVGVNGTGTDHAEMSLNNQESNSKVSTVAMTPNNTGVTGNNKNNFRRYTVNQIPSQRWQSESWRHSHLSQLSQQSRHSDLNDNIKTENEIIHFEDQEDLSGPTCGLENNKDHINTGCNHNENGIAWTDISKNIAKTGNMTDDNKIATATATPVTHTHNHNIDNDGRKSQTNSKSMEQANKKHEMMTNKAKQRYDKLSRVLSRFSILAATITISSLLFLVLVAITSTLAPEGETDEDVMVASVGVMLRWLFLCVDAGINGVCLVFYFEYTLNVYNIFCFPCIKTNCANNVMVKLCLCKCW